MGMERCTATRKLSEYLDGGLSEQERCELVHHLANCGTCTAAAAEYRQMRSSLRNLAQRIPPAQLETRLRVQASRAALRQANRASFPRRLVSWRETAALHLDNIMRPLALPLAGGLVAAFVLFGSLAPSFAMPPDHSKYDVPTVLSTEASVKGMAPISISDSDVVVDLTVDEQGRMVDYSIIEGKGQVNTEALRRSLENSLLFTEFNPATAFGQPTSSKIRLSFRPTRIDVKG
ncbi:MAG TPA: zf-HC2 domain-containing protein [Bryobacteraceae bacterium]|nr:zf-HC2 domain-containing protein [Bryobacteraceae bacterium]